MAAPKGNEFWRLRSKHGRDKLFATPELMLEAAIQYFQWCEANPIYTIQYLGKDADERHVPHQRPFTMDGLCNYLDCGVGFFNKFESDLTERKLQHWEAFGVVCTRIRQTIRDQKFNGAAVGIFNANIIARDLGLANKQELTGQDGKALNPTVTVQLSKDAERFDKT